MHTLKLKGCGKNHYLSFHFFQSFDELVSFEKKAHSKNSNILTALEDLVFVQHCGLNMKTKDGACTTLESGSLKIMKTYMYM